MSTLRSGHEKRFDSSHFDCLTDGRRRRTLAILLERSGPATEGSLATDVAAAEAGTPAANVSQSLVRTVHTSLKHVHLPTLDDAGLVDWDPAAGTITTTDHPVLDDPQFRKLAQVEADGWTDVVDCVADRHRRVVLAVLESTEAELTRDELARAIAGYESVSGPSVSDADDLTLRLHHVHLPKLDDADLIDYDPETGEVTHRGHDDLPSMTALLQASQ